MKICVHEKVLWKYVLYCLNNKQSYQKKQQTTQPNTRGVFKHSRSADNNNSN